MRLARCACALLVFVLVSTCGGSGSPTNPTSPNSPGASSGSVGSISLTVDGAQVTYDRISVVHYHQGQTPRVSVTVWRTDNSMSFAFGFPAAVGSYQCCAPPVNNAANAAYIQGTGAWENSVTNSGTVVVSLFRQGIATGTFNHVLHAISGTATGERRATGTFAVRFDCNSTPALGTTDCTG